MTSFLKSFGEVTVSLDFQRLRIVQGFFFAVRKKVLREVNHFKVLEKRTRMMLVSVA